MAVAFFVTVADAEAMADAPTAPPTSTTAAAAPSARPSRVERCMQAPSWMDTDRGDPAAMLSPRVVRPVPRVAQEERNKLSPR